MTPQKCHCLGLGFKRSGCKGCGFWTHTLLDCEFPLEMPSMVRNSCSIVAVKSYTRGYIGVALGYIGIVEKRMETTISGSGFRDAI